MGTPASPWSELHHRVAALAQRSTAFREALLADPRSAIERNWDLQLPADLQVRVLQETPGTRFLVLPPVGGELTDDQLETLAGGGGSVLHDGFQGDSDGSKAYGGDQSDGDAFHRI